MLARGHSLTNQLIVRGFFLANSPKDRESADFFVTKESSSNIEGCGHLEVLHGLGDGADCGEEDIWPIDEAVRGEIEKEHLNGAL